MAEVHVVGVRHHSPACAALVRDTIRARRPKCVLIEGPSDMNARMDELLLPHRLPIAVFSYYQAQDRYHASWTPFCDYSPEWVALSVGSEVGADVRFMDLPAWSEEFDGVQNRYADSERRHDRAIARLCADLGMDGLDALWDHLFEQPLSGGALAERLATYFDGTRSISESSTAESARERFMARCMAWAREHAGDVVAVCGGYHKPALERLHLTFDGGEWPVHAAPPPDAKQGSFLIPFSFQRLDSFVGYESGMPSPAYYQAVWEHGAARAADVMLEKAVRRIRSQRQPLSTADLVAASALALGLMRLRGHSVLARCDLLDGLAAAVLKEAQQIPLPWAERGPLRRGTDPVLVHVIATLSGEAQGVLAAATPRPPLLADVKAELARHDLVPSSSSRNVTLALTDTVALAKSRVLHRLVVLQIPGFQRIAGPSWATERALDERWTLTRVFEAESALIEASAYGATLETAALARLEEALLAAEGDLAALSALLSTASFAGIHALSTTILARIAAHVHRETDFSRLGSALARLLALFRHDTLLGARGSATLGTVIESAFDRGLWLVEGLQGATAPADDDAIAAVKALRDTVRFVGTTLRVDGTQAHDVFDRRTLDLGAPPAIRGAALGASWSLGTSTSSSEAEARAVEAMKKAALPATLGDFLAGLFALAREDLIARVGAPAAETALLGVLDGLLAAMSPEDFLIALPSLRMAHAYFPPRERELLARVVLGLHGLEPERARGMVRPTADPLRIASAAALDAKVTEIERRYGLGPEQDPVEHA